MLCFWKDIFYFILFLCMGEHVRICKGAEWGQEMVLDPLELDL